MLELFFGDTIRIISTITFLAILIYIAYTYQKRERIEHWGRRILFVMVTGLFLCILVVFRDNYVGSVQNSMDDVTKEGIFSIESIQSTLASLGGMVILVSALSSLFVKKTAFRRNVFFIISATFVFKLLLIEISRIMMV